MGQCALCPADLLPISVLLSPAKPLRFGEFLSPPNIRVGSRACLQLISSMSWTFPCTLPAYQKHLQCLAGLLRVRGAGLRSEGWPEPHAPMCLPAHSTGDLCTQCLIVLSQTPHAGLGKGKTLLKAITSPVPRPSLKTEICVQHLCVTPWAAKVFNTR